MADQPTVSRRGVIFGAAIVAGGGAVLAAGLASAQGAKVAPAAAGYQATPKAGAQCSGCGSFIAPGSCKLVSGAVSPSGWCSLYNPKT